MVLLHTHTFPLICYQMTGWLGMILQTISRLIICSNCTIVMRVPSSEAAQQQTSWAHYLPLLHSISWPYIKLHHQRSAHSQDSETANLCMDESLRGCATMISKAGRRSRANKEKLIFFYSEEVDLMKSEKRALNFQAITLQMQIWAFRYVWLADWNDSVVFQPRWLKPGSHSDVMRNYFCWLEVLIINFWSMFRSQKWDLLHIWVVSVKKTVQFVILFFSEARL